MKPKILIHSGGQRHYRSIVRHLIKQNINADLLIENTHNRLFDLCYINKPQICILPIIEYTQETHNYILSHDKEVKIYLYVDTVISNTSLLEFLNNSACFYICQKMYQQNLPNALIYDYLYDDDIYKPLAEDRNNKIAVSLAKNNALNQEILSKIIYPNRVKYPIVLFNNPEFIHPQNVGIFNEPDLNYIFNTFQYFVDIDKEFILEAHINKIHTIVSHNIIESIEKENFDKSFTADVINYSCSKFVSDHLVSYLGLK